MTEFLLSGEVTLYTPCTLHWPHYIACKSKFFLYNIGKNVVDIFMDSSFITLYGKSSPLHCGMQYVMWSAVNCTFLTNVFAYSCRNLQTIHIVCIPLFDRCFYPKWLLQYVQGFTILSVYSCCIHAVSGQLLRFELYEEYYRVLYAIPHSQIFHSLAFPSSFCISISSFLIFTAINNTRGTLIEVAQWKHILLWL